MVGVPDFFMVGLGAVFADVLADLEFAQLLNDVRADEERDEQRRERGKGGAKREIAKDTEWMEERKELFVQQPIKQGSSSARRGGIQVDFTGTGAHVALTRVVRASQSSGVRALRAESGVGGAERANRSKSNFRGKGPSPETKDSARAAR